MLRLRPAAFLVAAWILGATTSIGVGLLALTLVGEDLRGDASRPLTADTAVVVGDPNQSVPAPTATATPTATAVASTGPSAGGDDRRLTSAGGEVVARCGAAGAYLVYWTPAQGFRTEDVSRGPAPVAALTFEGTDSEIKLKITCIGAVPQLAVESEGRHDG